MSAGLLLFDDPARYASARVAARVGLQIVRLVVKDDRLADDVVRPAAADRYPADRDVQLRLAAGVSGDVAEIAGMADVVLRAGMLVACGVEVRASAAEIRRAEV